MRLSPRHEGECRLLAVTGSELAAAAIEISPPQPAYMPSTLEFENRTYTARLGRRKSVRVLIPTELLDGSANRTVSLASSDPDSITVLGGGRASFVANGDTGVAAVELKVEGRIVGKSATLRATVGSLMATARVACTGGDDLGVPNVELSRDDPSLYPAFMGDSDGKRVIKVFVRHPILAPYFAADGVLGLKDVSAAVVADVLADFFARDLTSRKLDPTRANPEVDDVYAEHYRVKQRMVKVAQACLVSAPASVTA